MPTIILFIRKLLFRKQQGFTLVEILIVVSIIALLSSVLFASFSQARAKARDSKRVQDLLEVQKALELYRAKNGIYPPDPNEDTTQRGLSCWDCFLTEEDRNEGDGGGSDAEIKDNKDRLKELAEFLSVRPCDPNAVLDQNQCFLPRPTRRGYYYKVEPNGTDYKIGIVGAVENINNIPLSLRDNKYSNFYPNDTISVASSNWAKTWKRSCKFTHDQMVNNRCYPD